MIDFGGLFQAFLSQFTPFGVFLALFAFIYASLSRSKLFHFESKARLVLSCVLALYSSNLVLNSGWGHTEIDLSCGGFSGTLTRVFILF